MSSLNKLIEKLAGGDSPAVAESVETTSDDQSNTDLVYVEKLASAVDFIIDNMESLSDIGDESDKGTQEQITKEALSRDSDTGRFVSDTEEVASEVKEPEVEISAPINISEALRDRLQARITAKQESAQEEAEEDAESSESDKELISNVLGKLRELKSDSKEKTKDTENNEDYYSGSSDYPSEKEIFSIGNTATDEKEEETASNEADGEAAVKAASAGHSLADVLNAALSSDERLDESISVGAETDSVHSSEGPMARKQATDNLKKKLMAKIGKEA